MEHQTLAHTEDSMVMEMKSLLPRQSRLGRRSAVTLVQREEHSSVLEPCVPCYQGSAKENVISCQRVVVGRIN